MAPSGCVASPDNEGLVGDARCAAEDVGWHSLDLMAPKLRAEAPPRRVRVAVVDSGLAVEATLQFEKVALYHLTDPKTKPTETDPDGHGTLVTGLIAADDGDGGTAGLASTVLGDALELLVATTDMTAMGVLMGMILAGLAHADIVNISVGAECDARCEDEASGWNVIYRWVVSGFRNTLFIVAALNQPRVVSIYNLAPVVVGADNFLIVGGTASCTPGARWVKSGEGSAVGIAAPAERVAVLNYSSDDEVSVSIAAGPPALADGNSSSAPIVTSAAAILKAWNNTLSPGDIVAQLQATSGNTDAAVSGFVLNLPRALLQTLVDQGKATSIIDIIEVVGEADPAALVVHRICGGADLSIDGLGSWSLSGAEFANQEGNAAGMMYEGAFHVSISSDSEGGGFSWQAAIRSVPFELDTDWPISEDGTVMLGFAQGDGTREGVGVSGALRFHRCIITQRWPGAADGPMIIEVEMTAEGALRVTTYAPVLVADTYDFQASGILPMQVVTTNTDTIEALETRCDNGYLGP